MKYKIGDVVDIIDGDRGSNYPKQDEFFNSGYCLFLDTGNVRRDGFSFEETHFITEDKCNALRKGKMQRGDIAYTTRGTVGNAAYFNDSVPFEHIRINSGMVILRAKSDKVISGFLYQLLKHDSCRTYIKGYCTGSAQPQLPIKNLSQIEIDIPSLAKQERISSVMTAYDSLIENNQKQIKLLEEAAQRLYKEWFVDLHFPGYENTPVVDGVPEGWSKDCVQNVSCVLRRGISPKYSELGNSTVINQKCIRQSILDLSEARTQEKEYPSELNLQDSDTVICSTGAGTLGRIGQVFGNYPNTTFDSHVTLVRANDSISKQYLYLFLKSKQAYLMGMGKGSTNQLELNRSVIQELSVFVPAKEVLDKFESLAQGIHDKISVLNQQIIDLKESRDLLLPRLMSEEIEV